MGKGLAFLGFRNTVLTTEKIIVDGLPPLHGGFPSSTVVKNLQSGVSRNVSSIPGSGRSPGGGHGNPLQYYCLGNSMERGAWWATVHGVIKESDMA